MTPAKIKSILQVIGMLLLLIAIIGGFITLGQQSFFYFQLIAIASFLIQIWVYFRKDKDNKRL